MIGSCAFVDCTWVSDSVEKLYAHVEESHGNLISPVLQLMPNTKHLETNIAGAYCEALATKIRLVAPVSSYSIHRKCIYDYATAFRGENLQAPICFLCACTYTYHAHISRIHNTHHNGNITRHVCMATPSHLE